jgi:hypothetical protein
MASREGAFDFLAVLQKNHGGENRYDRQSTSGSGRLTPKLQTSRDKK